MADVLSEDRLEAGAECRVGVALREIRLADVRERCARVVKDGRPLLDLLVEVLWVKCGVTV